MSVDLPGLPGDLILFSPPKKSINIIIQTLLRLKKSKHSHVAIVVDPCNVIHAMPGLGVHNETIRNVLNSAQGDFVVYRNTTIQTEKDILELQDSLNYHRGQFYNYGIGLRHSWSSSFCSELAALAFKKININISNKSPNKTLPSDIYHMISTNPDWIYITKTFEEHYLSPSYKTVYDVAARFYSATEDFNQAGALGQKQLLDKLNKLSANSAMPTNYKPTRDYWTNDLGVKFSWVVLFNKIIFTVQHLLSRSKKDGHDIDKKPTN